MLILGVEGKERRHCFYPPSCSLVVEAGNCITDQGTRVATVALCFLLEETQLFVVQSDFADVVSVGVVHLLIVLKLVVIGDWNSSWAVFRFMDSSSFNR